MKTIIVALLLAAAPTLALPDVVTYSARVENDLGAFSGTASIAFELFDSATGGEVLWTESVASVVIVGGDLVHDLGSITPLDDTVLERADLFLAVTVNGDTLEPRAALRAVPYALKAQEAESLGGLSSDDVATDVEVAAAVAGRVVAFSELVGVPIGIADGDNDTIATAVPGGGLNVGNSAFSIANDGVTLARMGDSAVGSVEVVDNALTAADLAADAVGSSEMADNAVGGAEVINDSLTAADLATGSVTNAELAGGSVTSAKFIGRDELFRAPRGCTGMLGTDQGFLTTASTCNRDDDTCAAGQCRDCNTGACGNLNCAIDICFNASVGFIVTQ